ncbi:MAG: Maf family nucleotide pyrophosphatase [Alphaproteobacteria bacterium]
MPARFPFVLASASPRRHDLLKAAGLAPGRVEAAEIDETPGKNEKPEALAKRLAEAKARAVAARNREAFVLGADTVVAVGRRVLPKAGTKAEAETCLRLLSGRGHRVYGGICVIAPDGSARTRLVVTRLLFKRLSEAEIAAYLESKEWEGKAGGYAIQGLAGRFARHLQGSYTNVVGLDTHAAATLLEGLGYGT